MKQPSPIIAVGREHAFRRGLPFAYLFGLVVTYALFLQTIEHHLRLRDLPRAVFGLPRPSLGATAAIELGVLSLVEGLFLFGIVAWRGEVKTGYRIAIAISTAAMLVLSVRAPFVNSDAYYYAYYGRSPSLASTYHATAKPQYDRGFSDLDRILARPVAPSVYAPLWQIADRAVVHAVPDLATAFLGLRLLNGVAFLILIAGIIANRLPIGTTAALLCNPGLSYEYLAAGHNDIFALAGLVWIRPLIARRKIAIALVVGGLVGASKISILLPVFAAFGQAKEARSKLVMVAGALAIAIALSLLLGGEPYFRAIYVVALATHRKDGPPAIYLLRGFLGGAMALTAVAATAIVLVRRRVFTSAGFTFACVSSAIQGWYLAWGLGYALTNVTLVREFAIALPILTYVIDTQLHDAFYTPNTIFGFVVILGAVAYGALRRGQRAVDDVPEAIG